MNSKKHIKKLIGVVNMKKRFSFIVTFFITSLVPMTALHGVAPLHTATPLHATASFQSSDSRIVKARVDRGKFEGAVKKVVEGHTGNKFDELENHIASLQDHIIDLSQRVSDLEEESRRGHAKIATLHRRSRRLETTVREKMASPEPEDESTVKEKIASQRDDAERRRDAWLRRRAMRREAEHAEPAEGVAEPAEEEFVEDETEPAEEETSAEDEQEDINKELTGHGDEDEDSDVSNNYTD